MSTDRLLNHAIDCYRSRRYDEASRACKQILQEEPENIGAIHLLGRIELILGRHIEGAALLEKILQSHPDRALIAVELGNALRLAGKPEAAVPYLRDALSLKESHQAYLELGLTFYELSKLDDAESCFIQALKLNPACWVSTRNLGEIITKKGMLAEAINIFEKYLSLEPRNPHAYAELAKVHLLRSDPQTALEVCDACLKVEPAYTRGFALKYIALCELGDKDSAHYLYDNEKLVRRIHAECPPSFSGIGDFNVHLSDHILNHPSLTKNTGDYLAAINGSHTGYGTLFAHNKVLGESVERMVSRAVEQYIAWLSLDPDHPMLTSRPSRYKILTWAVVTEHEGYAMPHIHPKSWIGGAYYVQLPGDFDSQAVEHAGWIEFGRGEQGLHKLHEPITTVHKPVEGDFIIFPGYFWHSTVPLSSRQKRICMAFDVQPVDGWGK
jgi:tetratricopeptide (TPR) repeat protein